MFQLGQDDVQVWEARLDPPDEVVRRYAGQLSAAERERAAGFIFEKHQRRWIVARGVLRELLGAYLSTAPAAVQITADGNGKPFVVCAGEVNFNLSHSAELAVYAFCRKTVGVDVEEIRSMPDALEIASQYFSKEEQSALMGYRPEDRCEAFFRCWTRKEAFVKAIGMGLSLPLGAFSVSFHDDAPHLVRNGVIEGDAAWAITNVSVSSGYVAAVATHVSFRNLKQRTWEHKAATNQAREYLSPQPSP